MHQRRSELPPQRAIYIGLVRLPGEGEELIQVSADPCAPETAARELRALHSAAEEHPRARQRLLVRDHDCALGLDAPNVKVQPAYEWLLGSPDPR